MSTINNSTYDLFANYSTAATYADVAAISSGTLTEESDTSTFADLLTSAIDESSTDTEDSTTSTDTEDSSTDSTTTTGTLANDSYYREDIVYDSSSNDELSFMDMLALMVLQFQNQTIDDTASTSDMMNQLCMMTNMQAMTSMESSITEMTATNAMMYNAQLVGQEVTVAYYDESGNFIEETGTVAASGYYDGVPVIFFEGQTTFHLVSSIMAIGKLPDTAVEDSDSDTEDDTTVDTDTTVDSDSTTEGEDADLGTGDVDGSGDTGTADSDSSSDDESDSTSSVTDADVVTANAAYASMTSEELLQAVQSALG